MFCILETYDGLPESIDIYEDENEGFEAFKAKLVIPEDYEDTDEIYWENGYGDQATGEDGYATDGKTELRIMYGEYHPE